MQMYILVCFFFFALDMQFDDHNITVAAVQIEIRYSFVFPYLNRDI